MKADQFILNRQQLRERASWVAQHVMPHEPKIRAWLGKWGIAPDERDELLQDAYHALWSLNDIAHIDRPAAYFFSVVRNHLSRMARRRKVVSIDLMADIDIYSEMHVASPEQQTADKLDCEKMMAMLNNLPERCRQTVYLRKVEGWSQKQIAAHLGVSEKTVEAQIWLGVRAIRAEWSRQEQAYGLATDVELQRVKR